MTRLKSNLSRGERAIGEIIHRLKKCAVCGWEWVQVKDKEPKRCPNPKCRSMRWKGEN